MDMLLLVAAVGPEAVVDVGKEVPENTLVSGHEARARVWASTLRLTSPFRF